MPFTYATAAELQQRVLDRELQQLSNRQASPTPNSIDTVLIQSALLDATVLIDSYLAPWYVMPITAPGSLAVLRVHCIAIARYYLHQWALPVPEDVLESYKTTLSWLKSVSESGRRGSAALPGVAVIAPEYAGRVVPPPVTP